MSLFKQPFQQSIRWNNHLSQHFQKYPVYVKRRVNPPGIVHCQPGYELHLNFSGRGAFVLGETLHVQDGRGAVFLSGDVPHQVFADDNSEYKSVVICFNQSVVEEFANVRGHEFLLKALPGRGEGYLPSLSSDTWQDVERWVSKMLFEVQTRHSGWEVAVLSTLALILNELARGRSESSRFPATDNFETADRIEQINVLAQCVSIIKANLDRSLTLTDIADMMAISPKYLSSKFRTATGMTLTNYIMKERISMARRLLEKRLDLQISGVAYKCGFKNLSHFSSSFSRIVGMSPSAYRALYKNRK